MGTRSTIALERADGTVIQVYCHWDGYLSGVGAELYNHYNTPEKLEELLLMGDMSTLGKDLENTIFYHRDRGEDMSLQTFQNYDEFRVYGDNQGYNYLMSNGELFYSRESRVWKPLTETLVEPE
jgi:hypothetical protein